VTDHPEERCNLIFAGELMPDVDRGQAQQALANFFGIADAAAMARFFEGRAIPLRRNLPRGEATRLYRKLRADGLLCIIETVVAPAPKVATTPEPKPGGKSRPKARAKRKPKSAASAKPEAATAPRAEPAPGPAASSNAPPPPGPAPAPRPARRPPAPRTAAAPAPGRPAATTAAEASSSPQAPAADAPAAQRRPAAPARGQPAQGKAPNYFALRPALGLRDNAALREACRNRALIALAAGLAILVLVSGLALRFPAAEPGSAPRVIAASAAEDGSLALLADNALLLHGRSGRGRGTLEAAALGLEALAAPLLLLDANTAIVAGRAPGMEAPQLWRCTLAPPQCTAATELPLDAAPRSLASPPSAAVLLVHGADGRLLRLENGRVTASAELALPGGRARLLYDDGLLRVPAPEGPMLGVYRPDRMDFARQLDALLLMPAEAVAQGQSRIQDVVRVGDGYWALLVDDTGSSGLYRFDAQWNSLGPVPVPAASSAKQLIRWRDKLLLPDGDGRNLLRFAADGRSEAPLQSELLAARWRDYLARQAQQGQWRHRVAMVALLGILVALAYAAVQGFVYLRLPPRTAPGTAILDHMPAGVRWLPPAPQGPARLRRLGGWLLLAATGLTLLATAALGFTGALAAAPALIASLFALRLFASGSGGHCGLLDQRLIVVDHADRYCFSAAAKARGSRHFLFLGALALPLDPPLLPNLLAGALRESVPQYPPAAPMRGSEVLAQLIASDHPWGRALLWLFGGWTLAAMLTIALLLPG
jgi:hypothetical protein